LDCELPPMVRVFLDPGCGVRRTAHCRATEGSVARQCARAARTQKRAGSFCRRPSPRKPGRQTAGGPRRVETPRGPPRGRRDRAIAPHGRWHGLVGFREMRLAFLPRACHTVPAGGGPRWRPVRRGSGTVCPPSGDTATDTDPTLADPGTIRLWKRCTVSREL